MLAERQARLARERKRRWVLAGSLVIGFLVIGLALGSYGWWLSHRTPTATAAPTQVARASFAPVTVSTGAVRIGAPSAPHTVSVYLDFNCSHCRDFETRYGPTITKYQDTGRVAVEYWPMAFISQQSPPASNAFRCAAEIEPDFGRDLHDAIFANFGNAWDNAKLVTLGRSLRPSAPASYDSCVTNGTHTAWALELTKAAFAGPAKDGTPTVYVDGAPFPLNQSPQQLEALLR